jgi:hypothetical protein
MTTVQHETATCIAATIVVTAMKERTHVPQLGQSLGLVTAPHARDWSACGCRCWMSFGVRPSRLGPQERRAASADFPCVLPETARGNQPVYEVDPATSRHQCDAGALAQPGTITSS